MPNIKAISSKSTHVYVLTYAMAQNIEQVGAAYVYVNIILTERFVALKGKKGFVSRATCVVR